MSKLRKKITLSSFFLFAFLSYGAVFASDNLLEPLKPIEINNKAPFTPQANYFNLANIVDNFLNVENSNAEEKLQPKTPNKKDLIRNDFISATSKFNQGNALSAWDEYNSLIEKIDNDLSLFTLAKVLYEIGFFSLGDKALDKITSNIRFEANINDLKTSFKPKAVLSHNDEIFFAKTYADIYFNASSIEKINELISNPKPKNDYYNYFLARAYFEQKNYSKAQNAINKAISINKENISYEVFKLDILLAQKKYADAKNLIEKLEKNKNLIVFLDDIELKKQFVNAKLEKKESEKKYFIAYQNYLNGNYEKVKKDCLAALNFDKENAKMTSLYAKSELATGNIERAGSYYLNSYKLDKNNPETLIGLGDIRFIHKDYKNSAKAYKKAYKKDKNNDEIKIKLQNAKRQEAKNPKEVEKYDKLLDTVSKNAYLAYYQAAISLAQKNLVLKEEYLKRALEINPVYENAIGELVELYLKNKNFNQAEALIYNTSFTLEKNYYYYYLCGIYNQALNKKQDAISYYKTSLNLNPNFEIANLKLLNLIPDKLNEEI